MREKIRRAMKENGLIAILRGLSQEQCLKTADALYAGGIRLLEVAFDLSSAEAQAETARTIAALWQKFGETMGIGAGTVASVELVKLAAEAGAEFMISPHVDAEVIGETKRRGLLSMPGAMTPSEIMAAHRAGADFVKLFPAAQLGADYIRAVRAPVNHVDLIAVGGVDAGNLAEFFDAGVAGAGVGGCLANRQWIAQGDFQKVRETAESFCRIAQMCKKR